MAKKLSGWKTKGMNRDLSVSAFNPEFAFENMNLRLATNDSNTALSWVNEKGTKDIPLKKQSGDTWISFSIIGTSIGYAILNKYLILFTTTNNVDDHPKQVMDYIYKLCFDDAKEYLEVEELFIGNLNFHTSHPIETLVSYETDSVQKVYWTDGRNQVRLINICNTYTSNVTGKLDTRFDFVPTLQLEETVKVHKELSASGMFAPGVIQYALTYYNKNGQESNIFYTSPLQYISYKERGGSPEDKVENAFKITIGNPDLKFDFLRIYSIQRTSINGTPICKRIQDISLENVARGDTVSFVDTGTTGDSIDPTELLYKGGDIITAETLEQKDSTLFMGGLKMKRPSITSLKNTLSFSTPSSGYRQFEPVPISSGFYIYSNQLTSEGLGRQAGMTVPCGGFKTGETYRLGVQFQHESGKWSEPFHIADVPATTSFSFPSPHTTVTVPTFIGHITGGYDNLINAGYKRMRAVVVFPNMIDRTVICQGVAAPTVYTPKNRNTDKSLHSQSSWFFRPYMDDDDPSNEDMIVAPKSRGELRYTSRQISNHFPKEADVYKAEHIRQVEIEGEFDPDLNNRFNIDRDYRTLHSPDIEFDDQVSLVDFTGKYFRKKGTVHFAGTMSDIDIQTETPTISQEGSGFVHKPFSANSAKGIVSGLFYDDFLVDDKVGSDDGLGAYPNQKQSCKWLVYPWQGTGYLNNDINRPADKGVASSKLKKKVISNLRYTYTDWDGYSSDLGTEFTSVTPQIFNSDQVSILKFSNDIYKGNIDTMLTPDYSDGKYFCYNGWIEEDNATPFESNKWCKTFNKDPNSRSENGIRKLFGNEWIHGGEHIGDDYIDLDLKKNQVRMKYKSTPHLFGYFPNLTEGNGQLAIVEITQKVTNPFGGNSSDALRENIWVPCGEPVNIANNASIYWDYGDTYFQRWDCLKTYAFTKEDINQIVEIGSFMLETRVNIDGRYDRNRGQANNLNMSPQNFNLINPVYSQIDNFFTYRIMPDDYYKDTEFPNQITWSKTKENGADVDLWTNVTLASILEMDGDKGKITSLQRLNDQLICFQDTGISQILYNENVQINSTDGVPIEIANSGKVQGKRYLSNTVGCSNKWSIAQTPSGIYFMDSINKAIFMFNGQLNNLSGSLGFNTWSKKNIPSVVWTPNHYIPVTSGSAPFEEQGFGSFVSYYDKQNQDVLFINHDIALAYSEKLGAFTSFYSYGDSPFFVNLQDTGIWVRNNCEWNSINGVKPYVKLWEHNGGDYCKFFNASQSYSMTLIGNPEPQMDKIFTNLEFRACVDGDGKVSEEKFTPSLPFDSLETWNEYQHGITTLSNRNGHSAFKHYDGNDSSLKRKFRIWRCDIPRSNAALALDEGLNCYRVDVRPQDRMRNPWLYLKLQKKAAAAGETMPRAEIHDILMTYFD